MKEYRIVSDRYRGYEVQTRSRWWVFASPWEERDTNTHSSLVEAQRYVDSLCKTVYETGTYPPRTPAKNIVKEEKV